MSFWRNGLNIGPFPIQQTMCSYLHITTKTDKRAHLLQKKSFSYKILLNAFDNTTKKNSPFDFIEQSHTKQ